SVSKAARGPTGGGTAAASLDDLIRPRQQRGRDREAEGFGGLEVDDESELRRLLDRQVGWLGALENLRRQRRAPPEQIGIIRPVAQEAAKLRPDRRLRNRREPVRGGELQETCAERKRDVMHPERIMPRCCDRGQGMVTVSRVANFQGT